MKMKKLKYLLSAVVWGSVLCLSGCNEKKPEPVSQDTVISEETAADQTVPDETAVQNETVTSDETAAPDETAVQDQTAAAVEESVTKEEAVQAVHGPVRQIEGAYAPQTDDSTTEYSYTYTYDSDMDLVSVSKNNSGSGVEKTTYEYLLDESGNKVKGFNILAYSLADSKLEDVHMDESLPVGKDRLGEGDSKSLVQYIYNDENQLTGIADWGDQGYQTNVYREGDTVIYEKIDGDSSCNEWRYTFDDDGHLVSYQETFEDGSGWANSSGQIQSQTIYKYEYDSHGKLAYSECRRVYQDGSDDLTASKWEYEYDSAGRPIVSKEYSQDGDLMETVSVTYDADGNVTKEDFEWKDLILEKAIGLPRYYNYNEEGRLESVEANGVNEWEFSYKDGLLDTVSHNDITDEETLINTNPVTGFQFVRKYLKDCLGVEFPDDLGNWTIIYGDGSDTGEGSSSQNDTSSQDGSSLQNDTSLQERSSLQSGTSLQEGSSLQSGTSLQKGSSSQNETPSQDESFSQEMP